MPQFSEWPTWLQALVVIPHALAGMFATLVWWPKSDEARRKFAIVAGYLLLFYLLMHFVFKA